MSIIRVEDERKWINAFIAVVCILAAFISIRFIGQLGEWFDLESKVQYFNGFVQGFGALIGVSTFIGIRKHKRASQFMSEVYKELVKVIWPDKESVVKLTIGIIIGLIIVCLILGLIDYLTQGALNLFYDL